MNVEVTLVSYLSECFPDISVSADLPNPQPEKAITLERTGGPENKIVLDHPTIAIQCWAKTRADALLLADEVDKAMRSMDDPEIPDVQRSGKYNFPDEYGNPRYQLVYNLITYI